MPKLYTSVSLLITQSREIGEKQFSVFGPRGGQNSHLMHTPFCNQDISKTITARSFKLGQMIEDNE